MDRKRKLKHTLGIAMYLHEERHILGHAFNKTMESDCLNILAAGSYNFFKPGCIVDQT